MAPKKEEAEVVEVVEAEPVEKAAKAAKPEVVKDTTHLLDKQARSRRPD